MNYYTVILALLTGILPTAFAADWTAFPAFPTRNQPIRIELHTTNEHVSLHWGVNASGNKWKQPIPSYLPAGSDFVGAAIRTPFTPTATPGILEAIIGPFNQTGQPVKTVDFVFNLSKNRWDNNKGKDYHIPVTQARISYAPPHPDINTAITITVHRATAGGQLRWGVNAENGRWNPPAARYRPVDSIESEDGLAIDTPLPPPDADGITSIVLGPFDSGSQAITSLHMAVHWDDNWDTDLGRNYSIMFSGSADVPVGTHSLLSFITPHPDQAFDATCPVQLNTPGPAILWLDGTPQASLAHPPWTTTVPLNSLSYGRHILSAQTGPRGSRQTTATTFWHTPTINHAFRSLDLPLGAHTNADGSVTFSLYAPGKKFVSLIGNLNQWDPDADFMNYSSNGIWWLTKTMPPGTWFYQYAINHEQRLADPYSTDVQWSDEWGRENGDPADARSVLTLGAPPYAWQDTTFQRPALTNLIIYELFLDDFCPNKGFDGLAAKLDYIRSLGVTAIEPMPWNEFAYAKSWGYNPAFHFAPETAYGTPNQLKALIDAAHQHGLAVIMDTVLNHMDSSSALYQLYGDDYEQSPYFYLFTGENWGFPDLDQQHPAFKKYAATIPLVWSLDYHVDGYRYDATRWVGWEGYNAWGASWFAYAAKQIDPESYQIAEHIPSDPNLVNTTEMDTGWDARYRWRILDMIKTRQLNASEFSLIMDPTQLGFSNAFQRIAYLESHDEERVVHVLEQQNIPPDETTRRAITALTLTLTAPGIPMLFAGQEFGENTPKIVGDNPINWKKSSTPRGQTILKATRLLCQLRKNNPALQSNNITLTTCDPETDTVVYTRSQDENKVIVAINFSATPQTIALPLTPGTWRTLFTGQQLHLNRPVTLTRPLLPGQSLVIFRK